MSKIAHSDKLVWIFRRKRTGRFVPAPDPHCPEGFRPKQAKEVLEDLRSGAYDGNPAGDHYVPCRCDFVITNL